MSAFSNLGLIFVALVAINIMVFHDLIKEVKKSAEWETAFYELHIKAERNENGYLYEISGEEIPGHLKIPPGKYLIKKIKTPSGS